MDDSCVEIKCNHYTLNPELIECSMTILKCPIFNKFNLEFNCFKGKVTLTWTQYILYRYLFTEV